RSLNAFAAPDRCTVSRHDALPISAFDDVAALVGEGVGGWWTAAGLAAPTSVGSLVAPLGDGGRDVPPAEFSADGLGGIAFVGDHPAGRGRWASGTRPPEPDACQDLAEHGAVVDVATGQHD